MLFRSSPVSFSPGAILGLTYVSAAGEEQFTRAASARGGRGAELQSKGKHGDNSFRLERGNCHQLSIPHVDRIQEWAANQSTAKKAPFWFCFEELKKAAGTYPPVWRCVGCHPAGDVRWLCTSKRRTSRHTTGYRAIRFVSFCARTCTLFGKQH